MHNASRKEKEREAEKGKEKKQKTTCGHCRESSTAGKAACALRTKKNSQANLKEWDRRDVLFAEASVAMDDLAIEEIL